MDLSLGFRVFALQIGIPIRYVVDEEEYEENEINWRLPFDSNKKCCCGLHCF